jgi:hypothetical protein
MRSNKGSKMRAMIPISLVAVLVGCQATSGQLRKLEKTCEVVPPLTSTMTWEVFGEPKKIEKCNSDAWLLEQYQLTNANISYQQANPRQHFSAFEERVFREALAENPYFKSNFATVPALDPKISNGDGRYATFQGRSIYESDDFVWCAYFQMMFGTPELAGASWGRNEAMYGAVCGNPGMSEEEFKQEFEPRLRTISNRSGAGILQDFGFKPLGPSMKSGRAMGGT